MNGWKRRRRNEGSDEGTFENARKRRKEGRRGKEKVRHISRYKFLVQCHVQGHAPPPWALNTDTVHHTQTPPCTTLTATLQALRAGGGRARRARWMIHEED